MIRPVARSDLPSLAHVIDATGLFPSEMLGAMAEPYLGGDGEGGLWLTEDEGLRGLVYAAPEKMTVGTWNMLLIAVDPAHHGRGLGTRLVAHLEGMLAKRGERILLVETSALPEFEGTRRFYRARGYDEEARIRDFYAAGEDKIVFRKALRDGRVAETTSRGPE